MPDQHFTELVSEFSCPAGFDYKRFMAWVRKDF